MDTIKTILTFFEWFFIFYLIGYSTFLFISVVVGSSTLYHRKKQHRMRNVLLRDYYVPVSIIVPAYNEEVTVVETVKSLLSLRYSIYEIIIVDDGSKDNTSKKLIEAFHMHKINRPIRKEIQCEKEERIFFTNNEKVPITLIKKKNGGKADALNMGINACKYPYFICMDADSVLQYDSLEKIIQPVLENDNVVAVGGTIRPANDVILENGKVIHYQLPKNILACMQVLEYDRSFLASRILFDKFNGSLIISGAFGLFKKETVIEVGGYDSNTIGEDMELVVKLHEFCLSSKREYTIKHATDAICWSQAPESLKDLKKQRKRWHIGMFQSMTKHGSMFANIHYGAISMISYIYFLIYELLSPIIEILGILVTMLALVTNLVNIPFMITLFMAYALFGSLMSMTSFFARIQTIDLKISIKDVFKAMLLCFFEITFLRFVIMFVRLTALIGYKRKKETWGHIERKKINVK